MASKTRHFVLVEPFGPNDVSIFDERDERKAIDCQRSFTAQGKKTRFITGTGTIADVRLSLKQARHQLISELSCAVSTPAESV